MKKLIDFKKQSREELRVIGREATFMATLDMFTQHPEILGVMWMYRVPIHQWSDDVVTIGDDQKNVEQDVSLPRALISSELSEKFAIPSFHKTLPELGEVSIVRADTIQIKLPAIAIHLYELLLTLRQLKLTLGPAWGEKQRIIVYRQGQDLDIETTEQHGRNLAWHEDLKPNRFQVKIEE